MRNSGVDSNGQLAKDLRAAIEAGEFEQASASLRSGLVPDLDYSSAQALVRSYQRVKGGLQDRTAQLRVAVLGGYTTSPLASFVELYLFGFGVLAQIYESPYGVFRQEILDPDSELYAFRPQTVFIATGWRDVASIPAIDETAEQVQIRCSREVDEWRRLWHTANERLECTVIQNNFDYPPWRPLGNYESHHPAGLSSYLARLNFALQEQAPPYVVIHDVEHLSALKGRLVWNDPRFYYYGRLPCAPQYLPEYAANVASLIAAQMGRTKKCLVLDLDNTLWGGVAGDDGLAGIRLGQGEPESEAFLGFQDYVKRLRDRGVVLAVCSKNDNSTAREVFEKHRETILRLSDFSCFVANWNDKPSNLRVIAQQLDLGLDALVFVDDDPRERALVRDMLPEVAVPEMPDDPADYPYALEKHHYFEAVALATEDLNRADYYRANAARSAVAASSANLESFLASLDMKAHVAPIQPVTLDRSAQLINRSNQFNLTTRRYSVAELSSRMESEKWMTLSVTLTDRFGDSGLISVFLASISGQELVIDTWVMSCRVLKRTVEQFLLNRVCEMARQRGLSAIRGEYIPTSRNGLVRNHYRDMGFELAGQSPDGHSWWTLSLSADRTNLPTHVQEEDQ